MSAALLAQFEAAHDETRALVLSLIEKLMEKKQNLGSVRQLEPFLSQPDVEAIVKRQGAMIENFRRERAEKASRLILPGG